MKSENLSSRSLFSGMWMKTLYRRDLLLAFVAVMAYFSVCIMPLILYFRDFGGVYEYYDSMLKGGFSLTSFISGIYAITLSVMLFSYLHSGSSAAALHSFPVTRGKLFRSTLMTGTVLLLAPVLLAAIGMFIFGMFMPPSLTTVGDVSRQVAPGQYLSAINCFRWFIDTSVGSLFMFAIANLAGIVAGKDVIHALLAYLLNSIAAIIFLLIDMYERAFILGSSGSSLAEFAQYTNPFIWYATKRDAALDIKSLPMTLAFIAVTILITLFTGLLYKKIKLEREQDATVFPVVSDMLVIFLTFCTMSLFGMVSAELTPNQSPVYQIIPFIIGCIVGGVPSFIVFRMIADSSVRILNVRTLITFIALLAITAVVFAFTLFDITDQAGKVPEPSDVDRVTVSSMSPFSTKLTLSDSESIKDAIALQKAVLAHKEDISNDEYSSGTITVDIDYKMKNGSSLKRSYYIDAYKQRDIREAAADLAEGDEYDREIADYLRKVILNAGSAEITSSKGYATMAKDDIRPFLMAYMKDYKANRSDYYYNMALSGAGSDTSKDFTHTGLAVVNITPSTSAEHIVIDDSLYMEVCIGKEDKHVQKFLEKNGYAKELKKSEKEYDISSKEDEA